MNKKIDEKMIEKMANTIVDILINEYGLEYKDIDILRFIGHINDDTPILSNDDLIEQVLISVKKLDETGLLELVEV